MPRKRKVKYRAGRGAKTPVAKQKKMQGMVIPGDKTVPKEFVSDFKRDLWEPFRSIEDEDAVAWRGRRL